MTKDQEKISQIFREYVEGVEDPNIDKAALIHNAKIVIDLLTPKAAKGMLESEAAAKPIPEDLIPEGCSALEINRMIFKGLLELKTENGLPVLYRQISSGAAGQTIGASIVEIIDTSILLLNQELTPILEADRELPEDERKSFKPEFNKEIRKRYAKIVKKLISLLWDSEADTADKENITLSRLPHKHYIANNKLANKLTEDIIDAGAVELVVSGRKKTEVTTRCMLTYEGDNIKLTGRQPFTEYDRQVQDAVISIYAGDEENHIITAATVYRAMVNMTETESPSAQQIGAVTKSLEKMRFVRVRIDCTEELKKHNATYDGELITDGEVDTYLLALESLTIKAGGQIVKAYRIIKEPIIYTYARATKQVISVDQKLLDVKDDTGARIANTEQRIAIKGYLLRRIEVMKGKTPQSNRILFEKIYTAMGATDPDKTTKKRTREYVQAALEFWKREKVIKGFEFVKKSREYAAVDIIL